MDNPIWWFALAAVMIAGCGGRGGGNDSNASPDETARVGHAAPNWTEPSLPGPKLSLASLRGKVVYLNFFATWCPPCIAESPSIDALARADAHRGLQVVGVDELESVRKAADFRKLHHLSYPLVLDSGTLREEYEVNGLPVHAFIDRSGVVRKIVVGELSPAAMRANVDALLR